MSTSLLLVSGLLGDKFVDLLIRMPDRYFVLFPEAKDWVWDEILNAVNQGIEDPQTLANMAEKLIAGVTASNTVLLSSEPPLSDVGQDCNEFSKEMAEKLIKEHGDEDVFEIRL